MLDIRVETFLEVCRTRSYTKAAEVLCITQPAVTQHIKFLESEYGAKLVEYSNRTLTLTDAGVLFERYCMEAIISNKRLNEKLNEMRSGSKSLSFAATLTIGEFTLAPVMSEFIRTFDKYDIRMYVDNTKEVTKMLLDGEVTFALVEGLFSKADFESKLLKIEDFILVAPKDHHLTRRKEIYLEDIRNQKIIVRENGSGSRNVLERALFDKNITLDNFESIIEIGNVNLMKTLVRDGIGLSFMYRDSVSKEIDAGDLVELKVKDFHVQREFNYLYLNNKLTQTEVNECFSFFKEALHKIS